MKAVLAPTNFANQPMTMTRALRRRGVDASHVLYAWNGRVLFGYDRDEVVEVTRSDWLTVQLETLNRLLSEPVDVFHFWHRSLVYGPGGYGFFSGFDLPYVAGSGARIVYRFTGYDLRRRSLDMEVNPYSPFRRGYASPYDEEAQLRYLDHLRQWADALVVQDPEMATFLPEAEVIPRGIDLEAFPFVGVGRPARPLVVHAPSSGELKGSAHVVRAVESLQARGVAFDFKLIEGMKNAEAVEWYRRADIVVDQLLIGWYGVLAVEGMALGKPVIAYVRPGLEQGFDPPLPIVNATIDDVEERLAELIADAALRDSLAHAGRRFAEAVHDSDQVAARAEALYRRVVERGAERRDVAPRYLTASAAGFMESAEATRKLQRVSEELRILREQARVYSGAERRQEGLQRAISGLRRAISGLRKRVRRPVRRLRRLARRVAPRRNADDRR